MAGTLLQIQSIKKDLKDPNAPFGVDLLLPQVGGGARKTNVRHFTSPMLSKGLNTVDVSMITHMVNYLSSST